ncbi:MAG: hypothetical protein ACOYL6_15765 [Bacteriovoracaceae bacterium]
MKYILLFLIATNVQAYTLVGFETDYCTAFKEGTKENPKAWQDCCLEHDLYYWAGGTIEDRNRADHRLHNCVYNKGYPTYAIAIYEGVRLGHYSPIKSKFAWNYGWLGKKQYLPLTEEERNVVEKTILKYNYPQNVIQYFLQHF